MSFGSFTLVAQLLFLDYFQGWMTWLKSHPTLILLLLAAPLFGVAWRRRVFPSTRLVLLSLVPVALSMLVILRPTWWPVVLITDVAILAVAFFDQMQVPQPDAFALHRSCQPIVSLGKPHPVTLMVSNVGSTPVRFDVRDDLSSELQATPDSFTSSLPPRSRVTHRYEIRAHRRGAFRLSAVHLRAASQLGLWHRFLRIPHETILKVYPDLKQLSEYALLARTNRLNLVGVRRTRRIGQDNEFERLRDYTLDDNYRHIDWRSTARRSKLTVKDFQTNQSQRVVFLMDCGRMMTNVTCGLSLLDHSLNAMLMLGYVALQKGDSVGLISFSDRIHSSVPLRSGGSQMNHLLHAVYDRFPQLVESRYEDAFLHLSSNYRKRSLVVLMTNLIDDVNAEQIQRYLKLISRRHLPLVVLLRDDQLYEPLRSPLLATPEATPQPLLFRQAAAAEVLTWRHQVIMDLRRQGVLVVDDFPQNVTAPLVNEYLDAKARQLL